jgi:hypothetical protein
MLKQILLSFIFGAIAVFSYAPFHIWPLAFVAFAGLLWLIADKRLVMTKWILLAD